MVVGGRSVDKSEDKAYALTLNRWVDVPSCLSSICDFPHYFEAATTGMFEDGLPMICGGRNQKTDPFTYYKECYKYNFTNAWEYTGSKNFPLIHCPGMCLKIESLSKFIKPFTFPLGIQTDWGLVAIGGHELNEGASDKIEFTEDGAAWETMTTRAPGCIDYRVLGNVSFRATFLTFSEKRYGHCQVALDGETIFVAGGHWPGVGDLDTGIHFSSNFLMFKIT